MIIIIVEQLGKFIKRLLWLTVKILGAYEST